MQDVATSAGVAIAPTMTYGGLVFDYDGDRRPDLLVGRHGTNTGLLHHNDGGRFSVAVGLPRADRHACASADVNADGLRDFYCSVGADGGTSTTKSNELWLQQRGGGFTNAAAVWGVSDNYGRGRQVVFFDANGDRRPDLFVTNDYPRSDGVPTPNRLFLNAGTRFVESRSPVLTRELGGREVAIGDVDRDGRTDIVLAGNRHLFVFRNTASGWVDSTEAMGLRAQYASDVALRDVNADGRLDLL